MSPGRLSANYLVRQMSMEETIFSVTRGGRELLFVWMSFLSEQNCLVPLTMYNTFLLKFKLSLGFHYGCVTPISPLGMQGSCRNTRF